MAANDNSRRLGWDQDGMRGPDDPNTSMRILLDWLLTETNYRYYRGNHPLGLTKLQQSQMIADRIVEAGCRAERTAKQVKSKIEYMESRFRKALAWSTTETGQGLREKDLGTYNQKIEFDCPHYFDLYPIMVGRSSSRPVLTNRDLVGAGGGIGFGMFFFVFRGSLQECALILLRLLSQEVESAVTMAGSPALARSRSLTAVSPALLGALSPMALRPALAHLLSPTAVGPVWPTAVSLVLPWSRSPTVVIPVLPWSLSPTAVSAEQTTRRRAMTTLPSARSRRRKKFFAAGMPRQLRPAVCPSFPVRGARRISLRN
jgi:hypothetical protein